jgi:hypothetical protein
MRSKTLIKFLFFLFLLAAIGTFGALVLFGLENEARVKSQKELTVEDVKRAKALIETHDPRKMKRGQAKSLAVGEKDLDLVFHYALSRIPRGKEIGTRVDLEPNTAGFFCSFKLPPNPLGSYLNLSIELARTSEMPVVKSLGMGKIVLDGWPARQIMPAALTLLSRLDIYPELLAAASAIKAYRFEQDQLLLMYEWHPEVAERLKKKGQEMLISPKDRERLVAYNEHLAAFARTTGKEKTSLANFMAPVFTLAEERSASTNEPILENQAAIVVLTLLVLKRPLNILVGEKEGQSISQPQKVKIELRDRGDLPKHFMLSAAIAATADSSLSNAIGLFKELNDAQGGSGFSFADLAADRAGVRFAELGIGSANTARRLQEDMRRVSSESDFMPAIDRLPEGMQELQFKQRYKDLDSAAYGKVKDEIERRIAGCKIFQ